MSAKTILKKNKPAKDILSDFMTPNNNMVLDFKLCYDKYKELNTLVIKFLKILEIFENSIFMKKFDEHHIILCEYRLLLDEINIASFEAINDKNEEDGNPYGRIYDIYPIVTRQDQIIIDDFLNKYKDMKSNNKIIKILLNTYNFLLPHNIHLCDINTLDDKFLINMNNYSWEPIDELNLNIVWMYNQTNILTEEDRKFFLNIMHKIFIVSQNTKISFRKTDVNAGHLSKLIITAVEGLKKQLPRCSEAFDLMMKSTNLFHEKYESYVQDIDDPNDASSSFNMLEHFIHDISSSVPDTHVKLKAQFSELIKFLIKKCEHQEMTGSARNRFNIVVDCVNNILTDNI